MPLPDILARDLDVVFVGINPGLMSERKGQHFARPGNRFWPALYASGFTPRLFTSADQRELLACRCGITNFVARATAGAGELSADELRAGRRVLERKVRRFTPRIVAVVGIGAYRTAFDRPLATYGLQAETLASARLWILPNTSGLNAHHRPADFARAFTALRAAVRAAG
jgi:TDG/mug DNA glycosylase family protein